MVELIIWFWALLCPNPTHTVTNHGNCQKVHLASTSSEDEDTGGETSNPPPKPPVPPLPPGN